MISKDLPKKLKKSTTDRKLDLFWDNVDYFRKIQGLSWTSIAHGDVVAFKNRTRRPSFNKIVEIAQELEVSPDMLFEEDASLGMEIYYDIVSTDLGVKTSELKKMANIIHTMKKNGVYFS